MVTQDGIQRFLDSVNPVILSRGQDYYRRGHMESIAYEDGHVTTEVSGSEDEPYLVDIDFSEDGEVEAWDCDCPYDWGPVCKHTVAALLAVREKGVEQLSPKPVEETFPVESLVRQAEKEQLVALVLEHCREDKRFHSQVLSELESSGEYELSSIKSLIKSSIRTNTHRGYIDEDGCDNICTDLDDALDKARRRIGRGQYERAWDIAEFVLLTGIGLIEYDCSSPEWTIDSALETIGLAAKSFAESGAPRGEWVQRILKTSQDSAFDGWEEWRHALLRQAAVLVDAENEGEFYTVLNRLSDSRWEKFQDTRSYEDEDRITRWHILRAAHGPDEVRAYLEQNLNVDEFRLTLIREDLAAGDYSHAEQLCLERVETARGEQWHHPDRWEHLLYEIYHAWGQRDKQIEQSRHLTLLGDRDFYRITKALLVEDGRWETEYPGFLTGLKEKWPSYAYMDILAEENEHTLLMKQVRVYRDAVFQYGGVLAAQYGKEIYAICATAVRQVAKHRLDNRKDYQKICRLLQQLVEFGGTTEAQMLIRELRQAYPRRKALGEELEKVEREIGKRSKS